MRRLTQRFADESEVEKGDIIQQAHITSGRARYRPESAKHQHVLAYCHTRKMSQCKATQIQRSPMTFAVCRYRAAGCNPST